MPILCVINTISLWCAYPVTAHEHRSYIQGCGVGIPLSPGSCLESETDSESASKSSTPTPGIRPVSSVVLDTNEGPVDRLLIKNFENFYFLFDGFPYIIAPVFSTPAFSTPAFSVPPLAPTTTAFGEWRKNNSHHAIHHWSWYQWKAHMRFTINE